MLRHPAERVSCDLRINNLFILNPLWEFCLLNFKVPENKSVVYVILGIIYLPFCCRGFDACPFIWMCFEKRKRYVYYSFRLHLRCFFLVKMATLAFSMHNRVRREQEHHFFDDWQLCRAGLCGRALHLQNLLQKFTISTVLVYFTLFKLHRLFPNLQNGPRHKL